MENFGCRASQADGDAISAGLEALGAHPADASAAPEVVVVNTCSVTSEADRDARAYIRRVQRRSPQARIVVTGCYAQRTPDEIAAFPGVFAVVGNSHKNQVASIAMGAVSEQTAASQEQAVSSHEEAIQSPAISASGFVPVESLRTSGSVDTLHKIEGCRPERNEVKRRISCFAAQTQGPSPAAQDDKPLTAEDASRAGSTSKVGPARVPGAPAFVLTGDIFAHSDFELPSMPASAIERLAESSAVHRTRPTLKIQDGCGNRCTFCIIPSTRGNSRSLSKPQVLDSVDQFIAAGGQELVISGINLGRWGRDLNPQLRFEDLLTEIFESTALPRLRISSVEPMDWTDGLIAMLRHYGQGQHPRLARHVHMPLQSGSDCVLRRMHRRYRPWHYTERLAKVRAASPDAAIGADVMVGFPGETDEEFRESYDFIAAQPLTYLHLFPFSARPGTAAWELHRQSGVSGVAVCERMTALRALIHAKNLAFRSKFIGRRLSAVTMMPDADGRGAALSDNFLAIDLDCSCAPNTLAPVEITGVAGAGLTGTVEANGGSGARELSV